LGAPLSLRAARVLANQLLRQRAKGIDIAEAKVASSRKRGGGNSFPAAVEEFIADHARPNNRSWRLTAKTLGLTYIEDGEAPKLVKDGLAQRWAAKSITEIDADLIHAAVVESRRRGIPGTKARDGISVARSGALAAALGSLFSWATRRRLVAVNPTAGMYRPKQSASRSRVLTDAEVAAVWRASASFGFPFGSVIQLLLITGQRRNEVAAMRWSELSDDFSIWNLPPARTKNKQPHIVQLPPLAREIVAATPRQVAVDFLFSTTGVTSVSGFSKFKSMLDAAAPTAEPWRIHDLRRTAVTGMAELGVMPHVIEAVVNHLSGHKSGIAGVYNRAQYSAERKAALELWADHVAAVVGERR
jgi:integrase